DGYRRDPRHAAASLYVGRADRVPNCAQLASNALKLAGVMMVRNEADIIEASVRHNLSCLDRLAVIDHGSFDGTSEILRQLAAESDAVRIIADPSVAYEQSTR